MPSVEAAKRWAKPQNIPNFDFFNYAGINRPVRLYTTPEIYIDDITLVPSVEGADGLVEYAVSVKGGERENLISEMTVIEILDENRNCVARGTGDAGRLRIPQAKLWWPWPGTPYLYTARISCGEDVYEQMFGIRTVRVEGTKFLNNEKPIYFK